MDARAVVLTGVYGSGKTTTAIEIVDRLDALGVPSAAIDVDWLGWYAAPGDPTSTTTRVSPSPTSRRCARPTSTRASGSFVLAWRVPDAAQLARLRGVLRMPLTVVRLEAPLDVIERRLAHDPNASRADDLRVAASDIAAAGEDGRPVGDITVSADRPVADVADDVLARLGWLAPD